jgi:hypothetical protein
MAEDRDDRLVALIAGQFEAMQLYMDQRFESMQSYMVQRFESIDQRFQSIDERFDALHLEMTERFISVDERFRSVEERLDLLTDKTAAVERRTGRFEEEMVALNGRFDNLSDDMRQRFRLVNERLSERSGSKPN